MIGVRGIAATYGQLARQTINSEEFFLRLAPGCLAIPDSTPLCLMHDEAEEIDGADLRFHDDGETLSFTALLPDTVRCSRVADAIRTGELTGASLAFKFDGIDREELDGSTIITAKRAVLRELSLVDQPALRGSLITLCSPELVRADRHIELMHACRYHHSRQMASW